MKNVFIFGAGASAHAGAPVMADFLDRAEELYRLKTIDEKYREAFKDVFNAIAELQAIHAKSYLDINNLEVLFSAIEMAQLIGKLGDRDPDSIAALREHIITVIVQTLELSVEFPVRGGDQQRQHVAPPEYYDRFARDLHYIKDKSNPQNLPEYSFLTFNYDLALDVALTHNRLYFDYGLPEKMQVGVPNVSPYLKLHGSINWGTCQKCPKIVPYQIGDVRWSFLYGMEYVKYDLGSNLHNKEHCNKPLQGPPVIVPPTWNKTNHHNELAHVWRRASEELASAENIFVIGYSLPETDSFFRYLFALGTESKTRIKRFWVFNPDLSVKERFRNFIGRGIEGRFEFQPMRFEEAIPTIGTVLRKIYKLR